MVTASGSKPLRKSCLKRRSCYDDCGDNAPSTTGKSDGVKKQKQSTLQVRSSPFQKSQQTTKKPRESNTGLQNAVEIEDDDDEPVIVNNPDKAESLDGQKAVGHSTVAC